VQGPVDAAVAGAGEAVTFLLAALWGPARYADRRREPPLR